MRVILSIIVAIATLYFVHCGVVQNNPLDENGPDFVKPVIGIDSTLSTIKANDTVRCDSATIVLIGNAAQSRFQISVDSISWSAWKPAGAFVLRALLEGKHTIFINTKYENGIKTFNDSLVFFVSIQGLKPLFQIMKDTLITADTGSPVTFSAIATGANPLMYRWTKGGSAVGVIISDTFSLTSFSVKDTGTYRCIASNKYGSDTSRIFFVRLFQSVKLHITYNGNGNTGGLPPNDGMGYTSGMTIVIEGNSGALEKTGFVFTGWNSKADGSGKDYSPGDTFSLGESDVVFFARWKTIPTLTITYNGNGNTEGTPPVDSNKYAAEDFVVLLGNAKGLAKPGYSFAGWNTLADGTGINYNAGFKIVMPSISVVLYAKWTTKPVAPVIYEANGADSGIVPEKGSYEVGSAVTVLGNTGKLVKSGYTFSGWNRLTDGSGTSYAPGATFIKDSAADTLYALWKTYSYTVTFDDQGATTPVIPSTKTVASPATTVGALPTQPSKTGYTFGGWYATINGAETEFTAATTITGNITVIAKWNGASYTVTFDDQGATTPVVPATKTVVSPATTVDALPAHPSKTGFVFGGWYTAVGGVGTEFTSGSKVTANITVYAKWNNYSFVVTYDDQGATTPVTPATKTVVSPSTTVGALPAPPGKTGFVFGGWYTSIDGGGSEFTSGTTVTANMTVYAKWGSYAYTITFDDQGATTPVYPNIKTVASPAKTVGALPTPPSKTGFAFSGWFPAINGGGTEFTATTIVSVSDTVYAKWTGYSYTVTFNDQSATTPVTPATKSITSPATTVGALPAQPVKTGYIFGGWWYNAPPNGAWTAFTANTEVTGNIAVYAQWNNYTYTVTFDDQGATTPVNPLTKAVSSPATTVGALPAQPSKTGYTFGGWYTAVNGGGTNFTAGAVVTGNISVYAKWNSYSYTVTFNDQGATTPVNPLTETVTSPGTTVGVLPTPPARTSYTFGGWFTAINGGGTNFTTGTAVSGNITVYAFWRNIVTYDNQGATTPANPSFQTVIAPITTVGALPTPPARTGYAFGGWFSAVNGNGTQFLATAVVTGNITVYAYWRNIVTYDNQSATTPASPSSQTVIAPATTVSALPTAPQRTGYTFGGWFTQINGGGTQFLATTAVNASITVYAKWNSLSYTVTFNDQSATTPAAPTSMTVTYPSTTLGALPTPPQKTGYTFGGWFTAATGGTLFDASTVVSANITVYAKWNSLSYTVTFDDQSATTPVTPTSMTVTYPSTTLGALPTPPQKTGYTFGGWFTAATGGTLFDASTVVSANITVYAKWNSLSYTVTFDDQSATTPVTPTSMTVTYPSTTLGALPTPPQKTGYTFGGWFTAATGGTLFDASTVVSANITVYAKWNSYSYTVTFDDQSATTPEVPATMTVASPSIKVTSLPTPPLKTGYTFGGWFTAATGGTLFDASTVVSANITVYAKWNSYSYTVTFDDQSATTPEVPATMTVASPSIKVTSLPTPPLKTGYTFGGWFTEVNGGGTLFDASTVVTGNITVYAAWTTP